MNLALTWLVLLGAIVLVLLPVWAATLVWVYRDAEKLGKPGIVVALLIGLLCWPVGLLVWLILRADYMKAKVSAPPLVCPRCGRALSSETAHGLCPACLLQQATASESGAPNPSTFTPPSVAELAPLFPQLEIVELLGRGGMGAVYKARQPGLDRFVALKILPATTGSDPTFAERFQREARALAALNHPHIVAVYDFGQMPTLSYFVMEYVDGVNLRQLERTSRLSPREALAIVPQVCEALQFAHDRGIVHRDIKPENILVDKQGRVKIADFGLAKLLRVEPGGFALTETRHAVGTPQYMAPEQVEKPQSVDHRADIYSLGVVFYEMLTGELPLGRFPVPSQRVQVDVRLDEVVLKALEKEPDRRYQQASAFKTNVETFATAPGQTAPVPPLAAPPAIGTPASSKLPDARTGLQYAFMGAAFMVSALLWGLAAGIRVIKAFHIIPGQMANSSVDLDAVGLVQGIHSAQLSLAMMAMFGFAGLSFLGVALFRHRYRARWFFWTLCATAVLMLVAFPVGTVLGVLLLVYVSRRRVEFVAESPQVSSGSSSPEPALPAMSPGQRVGRFGARVLFAVAALVFLWPVIGLVMDFDDRGHVLRFAVCWVIAGGLVLLCRGVFLLSSPTGVPPIAPPTSSPTSTLPRGTRFFLDGVAGMLVGMAALIAVLRFGHNNINSTEMLVVISCLATAVVLVAYGRWPQRPVKPATGAPPPGTPPTLIPMAAVGAAGLPKKRYRWVWVLLAVILVPIVLGIALPLLLMFQRPRRPSSETIQVPLVLNFEVHRGATNHLASLRIAPGQRAFTDIVRLPQKTFTVAGAIWPDQGGSYTLELELRNYPDDSSVIHFYQVVHEGVPFWAGALGEDQFRVTLNRDGQAAAQPVTPPMASWLMERAKEYGPVWVEVCTPTELAALKLADGSLQRERTQGTYNDKDCWNFMVRTGADLRVHRQDGVWWLLIRDGRLSEVVDENWRKPQREVIAKAMAAYAHEGTMMEGHHGYKLSGALPATYAFRTAEGGLGVLQVQGQSTGGPTDQKGKLRIAAKTFPAR